VFVVVRVEERFHEIVETGPATVVFKWPMTFGLLHMPDRCDRGGCQHLFNRNPMFPTIAKIVGVDRLGFDLAQNGREPGRAFRLLEPGRQECLTRIGVTESLSTDTKPCMWQSSQPIAGCRTQCKLHRVRSAGISKRRKIGGLVPFEIAFRSNGVR